MFSDSDTSIPSVKEAGTETDELVDANTDNPKHAAFFNIWKIDHFRQRLDSKIPIHSPTFTYRFGIQNFKCHMKLCCIETLPRQLSIESLVEPCLKNTALKLQIFLRNNNGIESNMNRIRERIFDRLDGWRFKHMVQRDFVETELIVHDVLTVIVKINIYNCKRSSASNDHYAISGLVDDLTSLFKNGANSDVRLIIGDRVIDAHKGILSCRSSVFADTFSKGIRGKLVIKNFSYDTMNELVRYCYTGIVNKISWSLLRASHEFNVPGLKILCEKSLIEQLRVGNAAMMLIQAEQCYDDTMKKKTVEFIGENLKAVAKTPNFKRLSKKMLIEIINIWSDK